MIITLRKNNNYIPIPFLTVFNTTTYTDKNKAKILAKTYAEQFFSNPSIDILAHMSHGNYSVKHFLAINLNEIQFIHNIMKNLKKRKVPAYNNITNTS